MINTELLEGKEAPKYLNELALWRIRYFREYPYLYDGNLSYEKQYLNGFIKEEKALLVAVKDGEKLAALSTALPLESDYEILESIEGLCEETGVQADEYFYFGEIIILPEYRGQGLASLIYSLQEDYAKDLGFKSCCILVVVREESHPLKPENYVESDIIWSHLGYKKSNVFTYFEWPTIMPGGKTETVKNKMVYWTKDL